MISLRPYIQKLDNYIVEYGYVNSIKKIISLDFKAKVTDISLLSNREFIQKDKTSAIEENLWIFPVCAYAHKLDGNLRAIFEAVKDNSKIRKIILTRDIGINFNGVNVEYIPLKSLEGQYALLKSNIIFLKHSIKENIIYPVDSKKHKLINLWHGIPLKRIGIASLDLQSKQQEIIQENRKYYSIISSSDIDKMAMTSAFYPLTYNDIWLTGLPRHDFILKEGSLLPSDFKDELKEVNRIINNKKFILYAPTFRNNQQDGYYKFSQKEKIILDNYLEVNNIILGIREHMADSGHFYTKILQGKNIIDMNSDYFPNIEVLYRKADILITDYSSCFIDFMLTGKPMISFAYDYKNYIAEERGLFYDFNDTFAGKICKDFKSLMDELHCLTTREDIEPNKSYKFKRKLFFKFIDTDNTKRVLNMIREKAR